SIWSTPPQRPHSDPLRQHWRSRNLQCYRAFRHCRRPFGMMLAGSCERRRIGREMTIGSETGSPPGASIDRGRHSLPLGRLERWMLDHITGFRGPLAAERFEGGQSNPTYKLIAASGTYVLRRKPFGQLLPSAHAVDREYRVMGALAPSAVPVPRV